MPITESKTRQELIDKQLAFAGWGLRERNLIEEFLIRPPSEKVGEGEPSYNEGKEFADYVLLGSDGKPIAIVEAKRTSRDALAGKRQAAEQAQRTFWL